MLGKGFWGVLIPKLFSRVDRRALCRTLEFFHSNLNTPCLYGTLCTVGIVMLEQDLCLLFPNKGNYHAKRHPIQLCFLHCANSLGKNPMLIGAHKLMVTRSDIA